MATNDEAREHWALRLNHHSPVPLWAQVARELRRYITERNFPVGHALPPEQVLAAEYGLSRSTVQQAYQAMLAAGQVDYGPRAGYCVAEAVPMLYVTVRPGSKVTAPAADPDMDRDLPPWLVVGLKVETPGMDTVWYDATRTTLIVS
jgi:DNA-binding transcriptional regulator YhcF (GntR family)